MEVLVNGTPKEISPIFDSTDKDITEKFLKEAAANGEVRAFSSDLLKNIYKDFNIYVTERKLPPLFIGGDIENIKHSITYNNDTNQIEMSENSLKWWEQYATKHNEVSALERQVLPYMQNIVDNQIEHLWSLPECDDEQLVPHYLISEYNPLFAYSNYPQDFEAMNLNEAVNLKSDFLREYAQKHGIDITGIDKTPDLSEHLQINNDLQNVQKTEATITEQKEKTIQTDMEVLVDGTSKKISPIFDNQGRDITGEFLKETIHMVKTYADAYERDMNDPYYQFEKYRNLPSTGLIEKLPPNEVEKDIEYNNEANRFTMSGEAFKWWEQYATKHNEVSALERQVLPHMKNIDEYLYTPRHMEVINLNGAVNVKSDFLREYAQKHGIDITGIDKTPDLSEHMQLNNDLQNVQKTEAPITEQKEKTIQTDKIITAKPVAEEISVKLKDENMQLKAENVQLKAENSMLKDTIKKLSDVIDRTNAILKENPSLLKAFKQAKEEFMQKRNSKKQERPIDKPKQESKPHRHNKR